MGVSHALELEWIGNWPAASAVYRQLIDDPATPPAARCRALIRLGRCLLETGKRGETDEAEELLANAQALEADLGDDALRGELLLQLGRLDDIGGHLKRALQRFVDAHELLSAAGKETVEVELVLASAERRRGEFNLALTRLESMRPDDFPERLRAEYFDELGALRLARGEALAAVDMLETALRLDDATATPYAGGRSRLLLAEASMRTGSRERAKSLIDATIATYDRANADAGLSEAYALLGMWHEDIEDHVSAGHYYQESYELDRSSDDRAGQVRAKRCLARTYRKRGDSSRARELLEDAKRLLPPEDEVEAAALFQEEGFLALHGSEPDYLKAISLFQRALEIAKEDGDERTTAVAMRNLARAYREDDQLDKAHQLLLDARAAFERRGDLRELDDLLDDLGEVLLELDENDEAEACLAQSLKLDTQLGRVASRGRTLLLLGKVAARKGDRNQAGKRYLEAMDLYRTARHEVGLSDALYYVGEWHLQQGALDRAIEHLQEGLEIDNRLHRPLGRVRAKRLLAAAHRQRGNLDRAEEYLRDARRDLGHIDDPVEHAGLNFEEGRLELASGHYRQATEHLDEARRVFQGTKNPVDVASCQRFLALAAAYEGRYAEALNLLEEARSELEERQDIPELDELYDDLGTVHLLSGRTDAARLSVQRSLDIGTQAGWRRGKGRSLLLFAKIEQIEGDFETARAYIEDALVAYTEVGDDVGQAAAQIELGDWYVAPGNERRDPPSAITAYKTARRLVQLHRDRRGVARCNRKLARIYLERGELQRADEALQDAVSELRAVDDVRELAPVDMEWGRLAAARGDHARAIAHFRKALEGFNRLGQDRQRRLTYELLIVSHQARHETREALECIREMGAEQATLYNVLVKDLHPVIASASEAPFESGNYADAIVGAFGELEREFKERSARLPNAPDSTKPVSDHIRAWVRSGAEDVPPFRKSSSVNAFEGLVVASFELIRNPAMHEREKQPTAADAFAALSIAHWIAQVLDPSERQTSRPTTSNETVSMASRS